MNKELFHEALINSFNGHATNKALRNELGLDHGQYLMLRAELLKEGRIKLGRGRGGTVHLVYEHAPDETVFAIDAASSEPVIVKDPFPEGWR